MAPAIGLDAGFALTIAAADFDVLQAKKHEHRRESLRDALGLDGVAAAERLMDAMKNAGKRVPGAGLALMASVGELDKLDRVVETFRTEGIFERRFAGTGFYQRDGALAELETLRPVAAAAYEALALSDFEKLWRSEQEPKLQAALSSLADELAGIDLIAEHKRYLTVKLDPKVVIYLSELSEPHGIRILGQRFVSSPNYSSKTVRRIAAHELIHPLMRADRRESDIIFVRLSNDPFLLKIVEKSNPSFGYSSIEGLVEEGGVQALEAVINQRVGQGRDQKAYWRKQDGGMHLFAAATYGLMHETGFAEDGGDMLVWLDEQTEKQRLQGDSLRSLAASVVGKDAVSLWL